MDSDPHGDLQAVEQLRFGAKLHPNQQFSVAHLDAAARIERLHRELQAAMGDLMS